MSYLCVSLLLFSTCQILGRIFFASSSTLILLAVQFEPIVQKLILLYLEILLLQQLLSGIFAAPPPFKAYMDVAVTLADYKDWSWSIDGNLRSREVQSTRHKCKYDDRSRFILETPPESSSDDDDNRIVNLKGYYQDQKYRCLHMS